MGHTVASQRIALDTLMEELRSFARALRKEDREVLERMLKRLLRPYPAEMASREVSTLINSPKNETPDVLKPAQGARDKTLARFI